MRPHCQGRSGLAQTGRNPGLAGVGTSADIKIHIQAVVSPFVIIVTRDEYRPVQRLFEVDLSEDMQYEWVIKLVYVGHPA
jgi:hypothetical protein